MKRPFFIRCAVLSLAAMLAGCASGSVVPASLQARLDKALTFPQLLETPDAYRGHLLVLGGEVLSAKRLKEGTRIELLEIPLEGSLQPGLDRTLSRGRFLAVQKEFLDPATIPPGTRVTLVGEVTGAVADKLDETDYTYPLLEIKTLKVWPQRETLSHLPNYYYPPSYYWRPYYFNFGRVRR
jgi:outer membrane lipoprotein